MARLRQRRILRRCLWNRHNYPPSFRRRQLSLRLGLRHKYKPSNHENGTHAVEAAGTKDDAMVVDDDAIVVLRVDSPQPLASVAPFRMKGFDGVEEVPSFHH